MKLIPNIVGTMIVLSISYGCMQYIPDEISNSQPIIGSKSAQHMMEKESKSVTKVEHQITKPKALQQKGFKSDKKRKEISKLTKTKNLKQKGSQKRTQKDKKKKYKMKGNGKVNVKKNGNGNGMNKRNSNGKGFGNTKRKVEGFVVCP